ncbi:glycoside hydrolase family 2 protein [Paenibacillus lemnae]|uniref:Beta-glucuronidase n=1 Tax=Paenibacillus lemnae TaxID=1330551 RepID=A0A848MAC2_PAELE|nr:glycoside hydrolase family 2 TIM barrel-domain containing protein [Paenibacillus lemnae]NMO98198.1 beta-glucuronidase [Paenibacillus lemnae]
MIRLFDHHRIRNTKELEGLWDFSKVAEVGDVPDRYTMKLPVPGCWESHAELGTYRGKGVYRKMLSVPKKCNVRLEFKGVSHTANVYFDGMPAGHHYNAYTAYDVVLPEVEAGEHELLVYVDNSFGDHSALHVPNDYYTYGGITRPVSMEIISEVYLERVMFTPIQSTDGWKGHWRALLRNIGDKKQEAVVKGTVAGHELVFSSIDLNPGQSSWVEGELAYPDVDAWSPEHPVLYELEARLTLNGVEADDWIDRIGFRSIDICGEKIMLNGKPLIFKGVNRHEDHPMAGSALPLGLMVQDLDLIRELGCNSVRTSHYPYDERFLDLCDELGILVWEENHARGLSLEQMQHPLFAVQSEQVTREMVEQHYNHPSIVIWAVLNECASDTEEGRVHYRRQLEIIREVDPLRPRTFASHHRSREKCFDLAEIVSVNLYPGWYTDEDPGELADLAKGWAESLGGSGKPMIISEFGGDGFYGFRSRDRVKGSEERQADILLSNLKSYQSRDFISGMFIWQFCDCRVTEGLDWLLNRSCTRNSKGLVDEYRRPKLAYDVVKACFKPDSHISE